MARMILEETKLHFFIIISSIFVLTSIRAHDQVHHNSTSHCKNSCGNGKSINWVPYPFGFSDECEIRLNCTAATGEIKIDKFQVQNITQTSIFISLPASCNRSLESIKPLFALHFAPAWTNGLLLQNCSESLTSCSIPTSSFSNQFHIPNCNPTSDNISCYSSERAGMDVLNYANLSSTQCKFLFSSFAIGSLNPSVSLELGRVQLDWWLEGGCEVYQSNCSKNANCTDIKVGDGRKGFRCQCEEGFTGDGFKKGDGCRKVSSCDSSNYFDAQCGRTTRLGLLIGGVIAGALLMVGLALMCYLIKQRSVSLRNRSSARRLLYEAAGNSSIPFYLYREIEKATHGFSDKQRLGTGAYGTVYAGKLHNEELVAIKRIRHRDTDSIDQVMNEIKLLSSVSHPNLVRLLGCCIEEGEQILVYEFMPNGTLCQHLQRERGEGLPWTIRLTVAAETANAIAYLHSSINPPIYHRDIKSSNILLDYNYKSKIADFGLSRLGMTELSHVSTAPQGTPGYLDPQYHQCFHLSDKSDVYSFGVVLVEIITALKVVDFSRPHNEVNLAALATDRIGRGRVDEIIDPYLDPHKDAWTLTSIHNVAELAFRCLAFHRDMRPTMMEVAEELEQIRASAWGPNTCTASSTASSCTSESNASIRSLDADSVNNAEVATSIVRPTNSLTSLEKAKDSSPVSVQDPWRSEQSWPSTNSLLDHPV